MTDSDLQALKRQLDADPTNDALARDYDRALLRGGRGAEVRARYEARLRCDSPWKDLKQDARGPRVRYCKHCSRSVTAVHDTADRDRYVAAGRQVAGSQALFSQLV